MSQLDGSVEVKLAAEVDTAGFIAFLEALCGIWPPAPLDPDLARWEDDGGPPAPDPVNYTHTIRDDTRTGLWDNLVEDRERRRARRHAARWGRGRRARALLVRLSDGIAAVAVWHYRIRLWRWYSRGRAGQVSQHGRRHERKPL